MRIAIVDSNRFGTLSPERLATFEQTLGTTLPAAYRAFLLAHNGGYVDGAAEIDAVHHVHGIHEGPNWARFPDLHKSTGADYRPTCCQLPMIRVAI